MSVYNGSLARDADQNDAEDCHAEVLLSRGNYKFNQNYQSIRWVTQMAALPPCLRPQRTHSSHEEDWPGVLKALLPGRLAVGSLAGQQARSTESHDSVHYSHGWGKTLLLNNVPKAYSSLHRTSSRQPWPLHKAQSRSNMSAQQVGITRSHCGTQQTPKHLPRHLLVCTLMSGHTPSNKRLLYKQAWSYLCASQMSCGPSHLSTCNF